jgi:hypothetical protein
MTAVILPFPVFHVRIAREGPAWLVICRDHGWLHGSRADAAADTRWLANNHGVPILDRSAERPRDIGCKQRRRKMSFDDTNRGALFREDKQKEGDRDYSGTINIGGVEYWLSGWVKTSKKGTKYLSLAAKPKDAPAVGQTPRDSVDNGIF